MHTDSDPIDNLLICNEEYRLLVRDEESGEAQISVVLHEVCYDLSRSPNHYRLRITKGKPPYFSGGSLILGLNFLNEGSGSFIHEPYFFWSLPCLEVACRRIRRASFRIVE
jgi:hypothetical protein